MNPDGTIKDNSNILGSDFSTDSSGTLRYTPNKDERKARKRIWTRYRSMADNADRIEAERDWADADQMFRMWTPERDPDDWRAYLVLPDAFAAIQAEMQETIERNSRPLLQATEPGDDRDAKENFNNAIFNYNMDATNFDHQYFLAKYAASIRGTAFLFDYYRVDRREIQDATDVDKDGNLVYTQKTVIDFDDDYTEWIPNEFIFVDDACRHIDEARDMIRREIMHIDEFKRVYELKPDFTNVDLVRPGGQTTGKEFFKMPSDMDKMDVEILHYYNRALDRYDVLANNVVIRTGPLPFKHKELPVAVVYHYYVPGRFWGMGVPKIIYSLTEERRSIRMLNLDRQKMQLNKMFLVNDQISLDDEDLITRPHGLIEISTNGLPINSVVMPLEYGDVPQSYFKTEEILLEDIRRAHGIDDRIQGNASGGTATEAAIMQQTSQRRINLIARLVEMDTMKRIGKLKWSNIQFFYPVGKAEEIVEDGKSKSKTVYKRVKIDGQQFTVSEDPDTNEKQLVQSEADGSTVIELNKSYATFMGGDYEVVMGAEAHTVMNKAIKQAKTNEMLASLAQNPVLLSKLDPTKTVSEVLKINDFNPKDWMGGKGMTDSEWMQLAETENRVMQGGIVLNGTDGATQEHTMVHLNFTQSDVYQKMHPMIQQIFKNHILQEHDANPLTGTSADAMKNAEQTAQDPNMAPPTAPTGPPVPTGAPVSQPQQMQPADLQPQNPTAGQAESGNPSGGAQPGVTAPPM